MQLACTTTIPSTLCSL
ncbi:hypothetical protein Taro_034417 [Colocasia esculenta]|uniref:Uncharacterized protein n=1 Tax=Colocasia esculenta TaxID=4460 RepID=A0A843VXR4_COLES|nr:hypothetical protein [Colocasia esculenta]